MSKIHLDQNTILTPEQDIEAHTSGAAAMAGDTARAAS